MMLKPRILESSEQNACKIDHLVNSRLLQGASGVKQFENQG
jgi:hypothetical protein